MNSRKVKQLREIAKIALPHVMNGYIQLKGLYNKLSHRSKGRASDAMKRSQKDKTLSAIFCVRLLQSVIKTSSKSNRVKMRPFYIRQQTGKKYKGKGVAK